MKILLFDVETAPMLVTSWTLFKPHLSHDNIMRDSGLICAAWKQLGGKNVHAASVEPADPENDEGLVRRVHDALAQADVVVGHNVDKFDLRKLNARVIKHGLTPLPPIPTIDTLKVARRQFAFDSNRLDYLGKFLGVGEKIETDYRLWLRVLAGDARALDEMVRYNKQDVQLLERVYLVLRPYMRNHPNVALHTEVDCCPTCGSHEFVKQGFKHSRSASRQQYQCANPTCRAWFSGASVRTVKLR